MAARSGRLNLISERDADEWSGGICRRCMHGTQPDVEHTRSSRALCVSEFAWCLVWCSSPPIPSLLSICCPASAQPGLDFGSVIALRLLARFVRRQPVFTSSRARRSKAAAIGQQHTGGSSSAALGAIDAYVVPQPALFTNAGTPLLHDNSLAPTSLTLD